MLRCGRIHGQQGVKSSVGKRANVAEAGAAVSGPEEVGVLQAAVHNLLVERIDGSSKAVAADHSCPRSSAVVALGFIVLRPAERKIGIARCDGNSPVELQGRKGVIETGPGN